MNEHGEITTVRPHRLPAALAAVALVLPLTLATPAGAYQRPGRTERVSVASDGAEGNGPSFTGVMGADGRWVAFISSADNLLGAHDGDGACVSGCDENGRVDVFAHDRLTRTTQLVSMASDGTQGNGDSYEPSISADGRYVAFTSAADNLVPGDTNEAPDSFRHDLQTGGTIRVSVMPDGREFRHLFGARRPSISADGHRIAFDSGETIVPGDWNQTDDVYVRDVEAGTTLIASVHSDGTFDNSSSIRPSISADGRFVAFQGMGNGGIQVHDTVTGRTEPAAVSTDGEPGNGPADSAAMSGDGRFVAFWSRATNLVPNQGDSRMFVRDRYRETTEMVVAYNGAEPSSSPWEPVSLSYDGRYVGVQDSSRNLVPGGTEGDWHTFVRDRHLGSVELASVSSDGAIEDSGSGQPSLSADGRLVAFTSTASNLVPGDLNGVDDVFVRDRGPANGIGGLEPTAAAGGVDVSGWASFPGVVVSGTTDPCRDEGTGASLIGTDISSARLIHRPEIGDLLVHLTLCDLPTIPGQRMFLITRSYGGIEGVMYGMDLEVSGTHYQVRVGGSAGYTPGVAQSTRFQLYRCEASCVQSATLTGGVGTSGRDVWASIPLGTIQAGTGATLQGLAAFAGPGEVPSGQVTVHPALDDRVPMTDANLTPPSIHLGIARAGATDVSYDTQAWLNDGNLLGSLDTSTLPPGSYEVWARACLGGTCRTRSAPIEI